MHPSQEQISFPETCSRYFTMSRRSRKEVDWSELYRKVASLLMPDLDLNNLIVPPQLFQESLQLLLNSFLYMQKKPHSQFQEHLANDLLLLVSGTIRFGEREQQVTGSSLVGMDLARKENIRIKVESQAILVKVQRKQIEKCKNDLLRQDREQKGKFLSQYLFCGLSPIYPQAAVKLLTVAEGKQIPSGEDIVILRSGLVKRTSGNKSQTEGSQLTSGCLISAKEVMKRWHQQFSNSTHISAGNTFLTEAPPSSQEETYYSMEKCELLSFNMEEFIKLVKTNEQLRRLIKDKVNLLLNEREDISQKCAKINQQFSQQFNLKMQTLRIHYPIEFKSRPKTAGSTPSHPHTQGHSHSHSNLSRSFRNKKETPNSDSYLGDFITFDRYEKMIMGKDKVVAAKASYRAEQKKSRTIIPINYEKKMKQQSKMLKLQSGKIQKLTQRDSKTDNSRMHEIKKNLFRVTHLFDQPIDPDLTMGDKSVDCTKNQFLSEPKSSPKKRMSGIKPEQFLKEEYLTQFLRKSSNRSSLKDMDISPLTITSTDNKQNYPTLKMGYSQGGTGFGCRKRGDPFLKIILSKPK